MSCLRCEAIEDRCVGHVVADGDVVEAARWVVRHHRDSRSPAIRALREVLDRITESPK